MLGEEAVKDPDLLPVLKDDIIKALNEISSGGTDSEGNTVSGVGSYDEKKTQFYIGLGFAILVLSVWMVIL